MSLFTFDLNIFAQSASLQDSGASRVTIKHPVGENPLLRINIRSGEMRNWENPLLMLQ